MEKYAIYKNENDLKLYIDKVARVFNKMEKDLGTYRLKDNNPERCLKMLKKVNNIKIILITQIIIFIKIIDKIIIYFINININENIKRNDYVNNYNNIKYK
jgi:hypothetical protein